jgi:spoIIIJ-associated protein
MQEQTEKILNDLISLMGIDSFTIETRPGLEEKIILNIINLTDRDTALLIGKQGDSLYALQLLVRTLLRAQSDPDEYADFHFTIDVMNYRERQQDHLTILAKRKAEEVRISGREIELRPMNAFERRLIHLALKEAADIETESIGNEPERRIIIKPKTDHMVEI